MVVADNGSEDGSVEAIRAAHPEAELIENGANLGFSGGYNRAIRRAFELGASWVVLLNNDAQLDPQALLALQDAAARRPAAGILAGRLLEPDGRVQWAGQRVALLSGYSGRPRGYGREDGPEFQVEGPVERAVGALMAVSREAVEAAGELDEDLFAYVEDVDWSLRIREAGFECILVPARGRDARAGGVERRPALDRAGLLRRAQHDRRLRAPPAARARRHAAAAGGRRRDLSGALAARGPQPRGDRGRVRGLRGRSCRAARAAARLGRGALVGRRGRLCGSRPCEARRVRPPRCDALVPSAPAREQPPHRRGDAAGIARIEQLGQARAHLPQDGEVRAGDRHAARHRLQHRQSETLPARRGHEPVRGRVEVLQIAGRDGTEQPDVGGDSEPLRVGRELAAVGAVAREREQRAPAGLEAREPVDEGRRGSCAAGRWRR